MNLKEFKFESARNAKNIVVGIVNPETLDVVSIADWVKTSEPQRATHVAIIETESGRGLIIAKNEAGKDDFENAQRIASESTIFGVSFRCPTREECAFIYDARFAGLDNALNLIDGDNLKRWMWTCESDTDPEYSAACAFFFYGRSGNLSSGNEYSSNSVRPVSAFQIVK